MTTAAMRAKRALIDPMCSCDNCGKRFRKSKLNTARDMPWRLDYPPDHPSCIMPSGECPKCGALCYATEGLDCIQNADIVEASQLADLNDACYLLQTKAGIDYGDVAGVFFSGAKGESWPALPWTRRYELLREYIACERTMNQ